MPRYWIFDPTGFFPNSRTDYKQALTDYYKTGRGAYNPGRGSLEEKATQFYEDAFKMLNTVIFHDEPALMEKLPSIILEFHRLCHKRGNGFGFATHRIQGDVPALFQINHHLFVFRVGILSDVYALQGIIGEDGAKWVQNAPDHYYWYHGGGKNMPNPPIPDPNRTQTNI